MSTDRRRTVTVTPAAARRDSRSLKQASSLARAGFQSILFEGTRSDPALSLPNVEVVGMGFAAAATSATSNPSSTSLMQKCLATFRKRVTARNASWLDAHIGFLAYLAYFTAHFLIGGLRHIPPASLYYVSEYSFFPAVWIKSRLHRATIAYDARDFYVGMESAATQTPFQRVVAKFGRFVEQRCIDQSQVFTTVGEGIAGLYQGEFGRHPDVILNAHDARIDRVPAQSLRDRLGLDSKQPLAVIVGQSKSGREFSGTLGALERLPAIQLALVGNGYRDMLAGKDISSSSRSRIHYVEDVPATDVVPLLKDADVSLLVYYARSENYENALPNGFFQSVAAGLPLLHSGLPEISRICNDLDFGVVVAPNDIEALTGLLKRIIEKSEWYDDQKRRSLKASQVLTWQTEEIELQRLMARALDANNRGRD